MSNRSTLKWIIDHQGTLIAVSVLLGLIVGLVDTSVDLFQIEASQRLALYIAFSAVLAASFAASTTAFAILFALGRGPRLDAVLRKFGQSVVGKMSLDLAVVFGGSIGCLFAGLAAVGGAASLSTALIWISGTLGVITTLHFGATLSQVMLIAMADLHTVGSSAEESLPSSIAV